MTSKHTKRIPLSRKIRRAISKRAVELYEVGCLNEDAYLECQHSGVCKSAPERCEPCTRWLSSYWEMHKLLALSPWIMIQCDDDAPTDGTRGGEAYWRPLLEAALAKAMAEAPQLQAGIGAALRGELDNS